MERREYTRHRPLALFLVFVTWSFVTGPICAGQAVEPARTDPALERIIVQAGDLQLVLEKAPQGLRVCNLTDMAKSQELLTGDAVPLFSATFRDTKSRELLTTTSASGWQQMHALQNGDAQRHRLIFAAPADERLKGVRVEVSLTTHIAENALTWDLIIANDNPQFGLWQVAFPDVAVRDLGEGGKVFLPITAGIELDNAWSKAFKRGGTYPSGWTCMQYMAAYNRTKRTGLYVGVHDPFASTKDIFGEGRPDKHGVTLRFEHPVSDMGKAGNGFDLPGEVRWQLLRGDWFDAALIYREWVSKDAKWWPTLGPDGREDTPMWMRQLPAWVMTGGARADCVPRVKAFAQVFGKPAGFHWYNWHQIPFDNDYPHYFPPKDGFGEGVAELRAAGVYPMPYINGRLWDTRDKGAEDWQFTKTALAAATKDEQGNPYTESYGSKETDGSDVKLAAMCPATGLWQNQVRDIVLRLFNEYGVSGVYIDQIAAAQPRLCFDASHGHTLGGGHWWTEGYWNMLADIRAAKPAQCMITTECNAEPYIKWLDGYLTWHWQEQNMVPAFSAVYGGAIQMFGRAYRGGPSQDLANRMKAGQQLIFGEQIGWFGPEILERAESAGFLRDCVKLRWLLKEYFYTGRMARPPRLTGQVPKVTADWQWSGEWPITTDAVMTGAWQTQDKRLALLIANVSDGALACHVELDLGEYGLTDKALTATAFGPDGTRAKLTVPPAGQSEIELAARSVLAWEIVPAETN